jgi:DNA-binding NarL/FixJ family response regulator
VADIRVLVVDDQKVVRDGLATLLGIIGGVEVVGTAADGDVALERVAELDPDVVLLDLHMPGLTGVQVAEELTRRGARSRIVVLTTYSDDDWVFAALRAGARGFLTKDASADEIVGALRTVVDGDAQLDPSVQRRLLEALARTPAEPSAELPAPDGITPREADVLRLIAGGRSNDEIARELYVSAATVKTHINHLLAKTGSRDRAQLVRYAYRTGLARP